jgi:predicted lysophospholipase L1 biosynthesis ABC-type transport system permease subunit
MHPDGDDDPFFTVKTAPNSYFAEVSVFSVSSFLRSLLPKEPVLALKLPILSERLDHLNNLFTTK